MAAAFDAIDVIRAKRDGVPLSADQVKKHMVATALAMSTGTLPPTIAISKIKFPSNVSRNLRFLAWSAAKSATSGRSARCTGRRTRGP